MTKMTKLTADQFEYFTKGCEGCNRIGIHTFSVCFDSIDGKSEIVLQYWFDRESEEVHVSIGERPYTQVRPSNFSLQLANFEAPSVESLRNWLVISNYLSE